MKTEKYGLKTHDERFSTEEKCRNYLVDQYWGGQPTCYKCGNKQMNYFLTSRKIWKCSKCKRQFSIKTGTIFESSNITLKTWFKAIFYLTTAKRGVSSCQLAKWLEVEQRTAWFILHRLREGMKDDDIVLSGIVEADETYIGPDIKRDARLQRAKKKHDDEQNRIHGYTKHKKRRMRGYAAKNGRKKGSTKEILEQKKIEKEKKGERVLFEQDYAVLGMAERKGKVVLKLLGRSQKAKTIENIQPNLHRHITKDSILFTDESNMYFYEHKHFSSHQKVHHRKKEYSREDVTTNSIENVWKHLKKMIDGTYFHMKYKHFKSYLNEHAFRWNRRELSDRVKVDDLIAQAFGKRLKYHEIISEDYLPFKIAG